MSTIYMPSNPLHPHSLQCPVRFLEAHSGVRSDKLTGSFVNREVQSVPPVPEAAPRSLPSMIAHEEDSEMNKEPKLARTTPEVIHIATPHACLSDLIPAYRCCQGVRRCQAPHPFYPHESVR